MPDTGLFLITSFEASCNEDGTIQQLSAITAECRACGTVQTTADPHIHHIAGGTVLHCRNCGRQQAMSNARFVGMRLRPG